MPIYDYRCDSCGEIFEQYAQFAEAGDPAICMCGGTAPRFYIAPACHGLSDGPGSKVMNFWKSDLVEETKSQFKMMEDAGRLRDPKRMKAALGVIDRLKNRTDTKIDYEKKGHPLDGVDRN